MANEDTTATSGAKLHRLFDLESAGVVTILLGLFQLLLSAAVYYTDQILANFFMLPVVMGIIIVTGGSFTIANEKNPSRTLLRGSAYSNVIGVLGSLLAFCLYCYTLKTPMKTITEDQCLYPRPYLFIPAYCPAKMLAGYSWSLKLLLLLYDAGALILHSLLSVSAVVMLKKNAQ
ncbi:uncharacterized protein si:dkey-9i23.16 [Oryzias melastigma]|uniref:uncharacterized protein si:dkey-9i23.16 n=1 Tax=Oryzias melastigma TaxID=30732 RepID=UPI00168D74EB|nr:uncharacterized protein si:dkey-9i23.16 [Oryzias melastigma]